MRKKLSLKGLINNSVKSLSKIAGISLALMLLVSFSANSQTVRYEAEVKADATLHPNHEIGDTKTGFSGTGYVTAETLGNWETLKFHIDIPADGYYDIKYGYNGSAIPSTSLTQWIYLDNVQTILNMEVKDGWNEFDFGAIYFKAGKHDIGINGGTDNATIDVDFIEVTPYTGTEYSEAEDAVLNNLSTGTGRIGYSGKGYVEILGADGTMTFTVNAPSAGTYNLKIGYNSDADKTQTVTLNGVNVTHNDVSGVVFPVSKAWSTVSIPNLTFIEGDNTVVISKSWGYTNIDYIDIAPAPVVADIQDLLAVKDSISNIKLNITDAGVGEIKDLVVSVTDASDVVAPGFKGFANWKFEQFVAVDAKVVVTGDYKVHIDNGSSVTVKDFKVTVDESGDLIANFGWPTMSLGAKTGTFQKVYEVTPHANNIDAAILMAEGEPAPNAWGDYSVAVRFNELGEFDARQGTVGYTSDATITYTKDVTYVVTIDVDVAAKTYTVSVGEKGTTAVVLATDYAFRKADVTELNDVYFPAVTWSYTYVVVSPPLAIADEFETSFNVYPNPVN
ncbi:MAG: hypothetical protein KAH32_08825, partial [Chlamydiia bacterium]|nr:hypothetical protein [Chlamydiia bacterium]